MRIYLSVERPWPLPEEEVPGSERIIHLVKWPEDFPLPVIGDVLLLGDDDDLFTVTERCLFPGPREVRIKIRPEREDLTSEWIKDIFSEEDLI